jgi:hypothetical protein
VLVEGHELANQGPVVLDGHPHPVIDELQHFAAL